MMNGTYNLIPQIRRAREYHLYDLKGRRYLDCCLDGGRALLGHKPGRTVLMMKNALDKGLSAPYPGVYTRRLLKQLQLLHPAVAGCSVVFSGGKAADLSLIRPFETEGGVVSVPADAPFKLLLPLPGSGMLDVVCASAECLDALPAEDHVPQYLLSGLCRAAAELTAFAKVCSPGKWASFNSPLWERRGPWLYLSADKALYPSIFNAFLEKGVLLSPDSEIPSCVPSQFTEGEISPIKEIERKF